MLSTGTASGKSLVFRCLAFHKVLLDRAARVLVFYPLKALAEDQLCGWQDMAKSLGFSEEEIGRIDGSVLVKDREWILQNARIVIMTPDVCHAWLMSNLASFEVQEFVRSLSTLILDEAHTLEGVLGSNFAFLVRRLMAARNFLSRNGAQKTSPLQFVAATATIQNPAEHLKQLTGAKFAAITHEKDGAPQHKRLVAHVACPEGKEYEVAKRSVHEILLREGRDGSFITFVDSRKGVEILAKRNGGMKDEKNALITAEVLPYRAGFEADDRRAIEGRLRDGTLRGVVSTSALELGIDIPSLRVGINLGVPATRKAYRQRLGRVGRKGSGVFIVIAPHNAFQMYGTSFCEYHDMSVEPSYLYLDNRFMQFAHARCLAVELESLGAPSKTPARVAWPDGFRDIHKMARPGGNRPPEFDKIADLGGDTPHHGYPLRNVGEARFQITMCAGLGMPDKKIGEVNQTQALRECYPGATYFHMLRAYKVIAWTTNVFDSSIRVTPTKRSRSTKLKITTWVNANLTPNGILENHIVRGEHSFLAECQMQVTEKVEGYYDGENQFYDYRELQQKNPNMRARSRNFRTNGIVLYINRDWFKGWIKKAFAARLREVFVREYSISTQDVHSADTNISLWNTGENWARGKCIVVYDEIYGSLRLTEKLYFEFRHVLDRLQAAADFEEDENLKIAVDWVRDEVSTFGFGKEGDGDAAFLDDLQSTSLSQDYVQVFTEGSVVCWRQKGQMAVDVKIIEPIMDPEMFDGELLYRIEVSKQSGLARQLVRASLIEPSADADAWSYAWWNRRTQMYEEPPEEEEDEGSNAPAN